MSAAAALPEALALRLNLQVSVSSLPVVGEELDAPLGRWIDSAPLPTDDPDGRDVDFEVRLRSDLGRVRFAMHGAPATVGPKLAEYLVDVGRGADDLGVLERLIDGLAPSRLGSFVAIDGGGLVTGWSLPAPLSLPSVIRELPELAVGPLISWVATHGAACAGLARQDGRAGWTELALAPEGTAAEAADAIADLFAVIADAPLPPAVRALAGVGAPPRAIVRLGAAAPRVTIAIAGARQAALRAIGEALALPVDGRLARTVADLGAEDLAGLEYAAGGAAPALEAVVEPTGDERPRPPTIPPAMN